MARCELHCAEAWITAPIIAYPRRRSQPILAAPQIAFDVRGLFVVQYRWLTGEAIIVIIAALAAIFFILVLSI